MRPSGESAIESTRCPARGWRVTSRPVAISHATSARGPIAYRSRRSGLNATAAAWPRALSNSHATDRSRRSSTRTTPLCARVASIAPSRDHARCATSASCPSCHRRAAPLATSTRSSVGPRDRSTAAPSGASAAEPSAGPGSVRAAPVARSRTTVTYPLSTRSLDSTRPAAKSSTPASRPTGTVAVTARASRSHTTSSCA